MLLSRQKEWVVPYQFSWIAWTAGDKKKEAVFKLKWASWWDTKASSHAEGKIWRSFCTLCILQFHFPSCRPLGSFVLAIVDSCHFWLFFSSSALPDKVTWLLCLNLLHCWEDHPFSTWTGCLRNHPPPVLLICSEPKTRKKCRCQLLGERRTASISGSFCYLGCVLHFEKMIYDLIMGMWFIKITQASIYDEEMSKGGYTITDLNIGAHDWDTWWRCLACLRAMLGIVCLFGLLVRQGGCVIRVYIMEKWAREMKNNHYLSNMWGA